MKEKKNFKRLVIFAIAITMCISALALLPTASADWPNAKMHYPQLPDPNGWDVNACWYTLADDWQCSETGWIEDIHFWGSWYYDYIGTIESFHLSIHSDIPAGAGTLPYSTPGDLLWELDVPFSDVIETPMEPSTQGWLKPPNVVWEDNHELWFQYDILLDVEDWFLQEEGTIYWLDINANVVETNRYWGWKSSEDHWNDDAVWFNEQYGQWVDLYEPPFYPPVTNNFGASIGPAGWNIFYGWGSDFYDDPLNPFYWFEGWYYYENTDWFNIWFYNNPFDPDRSKEITIYDVELSSLAPLYESYIEIAIDWSTDYYYYDNPGAPNPPLPPLDPIQEDLWIGREIIYYEYWPVGELYYLTNGGTSPIIIPEITFKIEDYNPEWVSIDIRGANVVIDGWIEHQCLPHSLDLAFVITGEPDDIPPVTVKEIGEPQCYEGQYVTTSTPITLTATDEPEGTGALVKEIHYIINGVETIVPGNTTTFFFTEECVHTLEFWAVDEAGNIEQHTIQTHYVDDTPPTVYKEHPEHGYYFDYYMYMEFIKCGAPIDIWAIDEGICASGEEVIYYRIWTDVWGWTPWGIVTGPISFDEECMHILQYYAVDCLGNTGQVHEQTYFVDCTPPTITKVHPEHGFYEGYLKPCAAIELWAEDWGTYPCESGVENLFWRYEYMGVGYPQPGEPGAIDGFDLFWLYGYDDPAIIEFWWYIEFDYAEIHFDEECVHDLYYWAKDNVCNNGPIYHQTYLVDGTPPTITKTHPSDYVLIDPDPIMTGWIKAGSIIELDAVDGGTYPCIAGVENIFWRYEYDGDNYPESGDPGSIDGATLEILYGYTDPEIIGYTWYFGPASVDISFTELGEHDLFYWAKDNVCNKGEIHHQIYWVNECQPEVWVDDNYHSATSGWWITNFREIQNALEWLDEDGIAHIRDGVYRGTIIVNDYPCDNTGITIEGVNHPVGGTAIIEGNFEILVDGVTIQNLSFMPDTTPVITVDADDVTITQNVFLKNCIADAIGVHSDYEVDAEYNYWGASDGPEGGQMDDGATADGMGVKITGAGPVHVEPFVGAHAEATASAYSVDVGTPVIFDATGSFGANFAGTYEPSYYWTFEPLYHSNDKQPSYVFSSPGNYMVSLRVQANGINGLHDNFMFDWAYLSIDVNNPTSTLSANGGGSGLGVYETYVDEPITLQGSASGGTPPYSYSWNLGDGSSSNEQNPTHTYTTADVYTVSLTVTDDIGDTAVDTVIVEVYEIGELFVSIGGPYNTIAETPVNFNSIVGGGIEPYTYAWDFGDDTTSTNANPTHTYESEGTYTVSLTVTDSRDNEDTVTTTVTVDAAEEVVEIIEVNGGFGFKATIKADDMQTDWSISVDGFVLMGHDASGVIPAGTEETVKIAFTIAFGKVDITVTAGSLQETYSAFALGPFFLNIQET